MSACVFERHRRSQPYLRRTNLYFALSWQHIILNSFNFSLLHIIPFIFKPIHDLLLYQKLITDSYRATMGSIFMTANFQ